MTPMSLTGEIKMKGSITSKREYKDVIFYTPGSKNAHIKDDKEYPLYNEIMGVFNVLETPVVHYTEENAFLDDRFAMERQFLLHELKYVINPASDLYLQEIYGSLVFRVDGIDYAYATPPIPIGELGVTPISFGNIFNITGHPRDFLIGVGGILGTHIQLKLLVNLKRKDRKGQNVLMQIVFPTKLEYKHRSIWKKDAHGRLSPMGRNVPIYSASTNENTLKTIIENYLKDAKKYGGVLPYDTYSSATSSRNVTAFKIKRKYTLTYGGL